MANQEHLEKLVGEGTLEVKKDIWSDWRRTYPEIQPDLSNTDLSNYSLTDVDLSYVNFSGTEFGSANLNNSDLSGANLNDAGLVGVDFENANLSNSTLCNADLSGSNFKGANLSNADLRGAIFNGKWVFETQIIDMRGVNLRGANLSETDLSGINFSGADLSMAILRGANLGGSNLSDADLSGADLTGCYIYAVSVWNICLEGAHQKDLIITPENESEITVDNLEVAQFIYLLLNNQKIRHVINTITSKVVLILGRFTPERKQVLDAIRDELRNHDLLPVVFDFDKPDSRDLTETVSTLAHMARFIIVDLTDPSSAPHEMASIVPTCIVPVQPLLLDDANNREYAMFRDLRQRYHWVLPTYRYQDIPGLLVSLKGKVIEPAEEKAKELEDRRRVS